MMWSRNTNEMKWDHRSYNSNLSNCQLARKKKICRASTGFEPVVSPFPLQCSTSWAMKAHVWKAGQVIYWALQHERKGHGLEFHWSPKIYIFRANSQLVILWVQLWWWHLQFICHILLKASDLVGLRGGLAWFGGYTWLLSQAKPSLISKKIIHFITR